MNFRLMFRGDDTFLQRAAVQVTLFNMQKREEQEAEEAE